MDLKLKALQTDKWFLWVGTKNQKLIPELTEFRNHQKINTRQIIITHYKYLSLCIVFFFFFSKFMEMLVFKVGVIILFVVITTMNGEVSSGTNP